MLCARGLHPSGMLVWYPLPSPSSSPPLFCSLVFFILFSVFFKLVSELIMASLGSRARVPLSRLRNRHCSTHFTLSSH